MGLGGLDFGSVDIEHTVTGCAQVCPWFVNPLRFTSTSDAGSNQGLLWLHPHDPSFV